MVVALLTFAVSGGAPLDAQKPLPIELAELPRPPAPIQALIESGRLKFEAGQREVSSQPADRPRITAETHYRIAFNYRSRSRWRVEDRMRTIVINVRYDRVEWTPTHTIWFLQRPASEGFWSDPLVRHEFDHVRISSDRRLAVQFEQMLKRTSVLNRPISDSDVVNQKFVDQIVDQHVAEVFAEISELISIRYKELDRVTEHGRRGVPSDSPLNQWLSPDGANSP